MSINLYWTVCVNCICPLCGCGDLYYGWYFLRLSQPLHPCTSRFIWSLSLSVDDSADEEPTTQSDHSEIQGTLKTLASKLDDLSTCNDLIAKHGAALQRSLSELEALRVPLEGGEKIKAVNERATLFRITSNAMINVSAHVISSFYIQGC